MSAPPTRNLFVEQARNRRATWGLVLVFVGFLAFLGLGFDLFVLGLGLGRTGGVPVGAVTAGLFGAGSAFLSYRFGDRAVLASSRARRAW